MEINGGLFVILASVIFPVTLVVTYSISLYNKHIISIWPYMSHTGDDATESCFFSLGLNTVAGLYALIVFLRYAQIDDILLDDPQRRRIILNRSSLGWGITASFALSMTSCFQQRNVGFVHIIAAVICSYAALVYFWHQTVFSHLFARWITRRAKIYRSVLISLSTVIHCVAPVIYLCSIAVVPMPQGRVTKWEEGNDAGMILFLTGSFMEWSVFLINELYIASFFNEFRNIRFRLGELLFLRRELEIR